MKQKTLSEYLKGIYGEKVYKICLSSGCTCPNRDGSKGFSGCDFCLNGSGEFASVGEIDKQFEEAKKKISKKTDAKKFIAYFQSFSNTYGDVDKLTKLYTEVINREDVVILSVATRPDCLDDKSLAMLEKLNKIKPVWVELGLQTVNDRSMKELNLGYDKNDFLIAYRRLKERGLSVVAHLIFSLPYETEEDNLSAVKFLGQLDPVIDGVKIQMLHVLEGTKLGERYKKEPFPLLTSEEYGDRLKKSLEILPSTVVIHRITGDPPRKYLIAPDWTIDKKKTLNYLKKVLSIE